MIFDSVKNYIILALLALCTVLGLSTWQYRRMNAATAYALETQNAAIVSQKANAQNLLATLTERAERAEKELKDRADAQEKVDALAKDTIARDDARQRAAPVSVRYVTRGCGPSGGGTSGEAPAAAKSGDDHLPTAIGVLPPAGARRLADALTEVETLNAAYASCRTALLKE